MSTIIGTAESDSLSGTDSGDLIKGLNGADTLDGQGGADTIEGGAGDDTIYGSSFEDDGARDSLSGGAGNDTVWGWVGDSLDGGAGYDTFFLELFNADGPVKADFDGLSHGTVSLGKDGQLATLSNFEHGILELTSFDDVVRSGDTHLVVEGNGGNDRIELDVSGYADGGAGNDTVIGSSGDDIIEDNGGGVDHIDAGAGNDLVYLGNDSGVLDGGAGNDQLNHSTGAMLIRGGAGDDVISDSGKETVLGGAGDDVIAAHAGQLDGGPGHDTLELSVYAADPITVDLNPLAHGGVADVGAIASLHGFEAGWIDFSGAGVTVNIGDAGFLEVDGGFGDDLVTCGDGGDTVTGGGGDDTVIAGAGDDVLSGGRGADTVSYQAAASGVSLDLADRAGQQTGGSGKDLVLGFKNAVGSDFDDLLKGTQHDNRLEGGGGDDSLVGGRGADALTGGGGSDHFIFTDIRDSLSSAPDVITDLHAGDVVDLGRIDADTSQAGDQAFVLVSQLTGVAGQAAMTYDASSHQTRLMLDVNGDGAADSVVLIDGDATAFTGFVL